MGSVFIVIAPASMGPHGAVAVLVKRYGCTKDHHWHRHKPVSTVLIVFCQTILAPYARVRVQLSVSSSAREPEVGRAARHAQPSLPLEAHVRYLTE